MPGRGYRTGANGDGRGAAGGTVSPPRPSVKANKGVAAVSRAVLGRSSLYGMALARPGRLQVTATFITLFYDAS